MSSIYRTLGSDDRAGLATDFGFLVRSQAQSLSPASTLSSLLLLAAAGLWYLQPALGPWPLILVAATLATRLLTGLPVLPRTPFQWPLLLYLVAAAWGAWINPLPVDPWPRFWVFVGSVVLYYSVVLAPDWIQVRPDWRLYPLRVALAVLPAVIAVYFMLTVDLVEWGDKLAWLGPGLSWLAAIHLDLPGHALHPNVAGGLIAALIPLQLAAWRMGPRRGVKTLAALILVGLSLLGLLASTSRGAWLALAVVGGAWGVVRFNRGMAQLLAGREQPGPGWRLAVWVPTAIAAILLAAVLIISPLRSLALEAASSRLELWADTIRLAMDTPLTGIGYDGFQMAYVTYVLLLHVGFQPHSHNLVLEIWLQQGILGIIALGWLVVTVVRLRRSPSPWRLAALASLGVILIHGLADIPLYGGRGMMLWFVPLALLVRTPEGDGRLVALPARRNVSLALAGLAVAAAALLAFVPAGESVLQANLGALEQTRAELAVYSWPQWRIQDELRRSPEIDLAPAIARYRRALAANPANPVANRRLGQIELSRGEYEAALQHLEAAYAAAPGHRATRQLLGELYAMNGQPERARALWQTIDLDLKQLDLRVWWYNHIGEPEHAAAIQGAATP